jgi:hypothetical protein
MRWLRYAYFLRFSLMLWLFAPALCLLNWKDKTLTSGILVPETLEQYLCVGFFLVSAGFAALTQARIVLINGPGRWDLGPVHENDGRPARLRKLLADEAGESEWLALIVSQIPTLVVFIYLLCFGIRQEVSQWHIWLGLIVGFVLSVAFWWVANAWYYLTYEPPQQADAHGLVSFEKNAAQTILFPRNFFWLDPVGAKPQRSSIERATTVLPGFMARSLGGRLVRRENLEIIGQKQSIETFFFALTSWGAFLWLYATIWPLTAPVAASVISWIMIGILTLAVAVALYICWTATPAKGGSLTGMQIGLTIGVLAFLGAVLTLYLRGSVERFPILATVLILAIFLSWIFGGLAFLLDRHRIPVLTVLVLFVVVPRIFHWDRAPYFDNGPWRGQDEHYLSTVEATGDLANAMPKTPAEILAAHMARNDGKPLIVVTATGGGLHAAAWTATILAQLEKNFGPDFHNHLLLLSTVSGGSVGLLGYLRELHEGTLDSNPTLAMERMQSAAQCSSLEGVGWGLVYYDLPKAVVPVVPYFIPPSSGDGDLDTKGAWKSPLLKDRTWALRRSFARNLNNEFCDKLWAEENPKPEGQKPIHAEKDAHPEDGLTLRAFLNTDDLPAFTMNTTTVEDGERFLLANYRIPDGAVYSEGTYKSRSFLASFPGKDGKTDLPLATAAQLSATFPYVSSAARVPLSVDSANNSVHFVDGGYYDNDGTASVIEFLRYALASDQVNAPVKILLIEIRNSGDVRPSSPENKPDQTESKYPWNFDDQSTAPLLAFWQAGHESVTIRNRVALELLEQVFGHKLKLARVVFADSNSKEAVGTDPLNWSLTPRQRKEVRESAGNLEDSFSTAECWFGSWDNIWGKPEETRNEICAPKANAAAPGTAH